MLNITGCLLPALRHGYRHGDGGAHHGVVAHARRQTFFVFPVLNIARFYRKAEFFRQLISVRAPFVFLKLLWFY